MDEEYQPTRKCRGCGRHYIAGFFRPAEHYAYHGCSTRDRERHRDHGSYGDATERKIKEVAK